MIKLPMKATVFLVSVTSPHVPLFDITQVILMIYMYGYLVKLGTRSMDSIKYCLLIKKTFTLPTKLFGYSQSLGSRGLQ